MKKIFCLVFISLLIVTGCGKNKENINNMDKVIKDIEVVASKKLNVNTPQLIQHNNSKIIRLEIRPNGADKFNQINIKIYTENDELVKELSLPIDEEIYKGQVFIIEEEYNYDDKLPYKIIIETKFIEIDNSIDSSVDH